MFNSFNVFNVLNVSEIELKLMFSILVINKLNLVISTFESNSLDTSIILDFKFNILSISAFEYVNILSHFKFNLLFNSN